MKKYFIFLFMFIAAIGFTQVSVPTNLSVKGIADWVRNFEFISQSIDVVMPEVPSKRGIQYIKWSDVAYPEHYMSNGTSWVLMNGRIFNQGTAEKPGMAFKNDELTGFFSGGLNTIGFSTGAVERMRLNGQGRLLLGSAFDNGVHRLQVTGDTKLSGNLLVTGTITGAIEATGILGRGDGLTGNDYSGLQSTVWAVDFGTSSNQAARGNHNHALLTNGVGLTGNNYDGSTATTFAVSYGSTAGTACEGNDTRLSDARTPISHGLLDHTVSALTTNHYLKATSASTFGFSAIALTDLGLAATLTTAELNYVDGVTSDIQTQINGKQATITGAATTVVSSNLTASVAMVTDASGKISNSTTVSATELGYLDGVTSAIQTQLGGKQATITGGATTIVSSNLTASRALVSDSSGKVAVSAVTSTELGYVDGVTSAIQTQINGKAATSHTHLYAGSASAGGAASSVASTLTRGTGLSGSNFNGSAATTWAVSYGTTSGTAAQGNDSRFGQVKTSTPASPVSGDIWFE